MRTILRNKTTDFYFQGVSDWTEQPPEAFDFKSPERVIRFVLAAGLNVNEMEIVFAFDDARYNIGLPIDERFGMKATTAEVRQQPERVRLHRPVLAQVMMLGNEAMAAPPSPSSP
jgi:hypothetical protein